MAKKRKKHTGGPKTWATAPGIFKSVSVDWDELEARHKSAADSSWLQQVHDEAQRVIDAADHPDDPPMSQAAKRHATKVQWGVGDLSKSLFAVADDNERAKWSSILNYAFNVGVEWERMRTRPFEPYVKQKRSLAPSGGKGLQDKYANYHDEWRRLAETIVKGLTKKPTIGRVCELVAQQAAHPVTDKRFNPVVIQRKITNDVKKIISKYFA